MSETGAFSGPVPKLLAIAAVIGWAFALYAFNTQSNLQVELMRQNKAVGTLKSLQDEVTVLTTDTDRLTGERDVVGADLTTQQEQLAALMEQISTADIDLGQRQSELTTLDEQVSPLRDEIAAFDTARTEAEQRLSTSTQELADVGERLAEARTIEAEVQKQLSSLTDETARLTAESSDAQMRVQEARDAEASLQSTLAAATDEFARIKSERDTLSQAIDGMTQRRDQLVADNSAAAEQRESVQAMVTQLTEDLAARSQQLAEVERRVTDLQTQEDADPMAQEAITPDGQENTDPAAQDSTDTPAQENAADGSDVSLKPGVYTVGPLAVTLDDNGGFVLRNETRGEEITGSYAVADGNLTLSEPEGNIGTTPFPMTCALRQSEQGLMLEQSGDAPCALAGLSVEAQE
jgi:predicted  nucleic acid-binding Zn-ribbon protein